MHPGSVAKRVDGYVVVIDPCMARNGTFSPRYRIYGEDRLAVASQEFPADCFDRSGAIALSEELASATLAELKQLGRFAGPSPLAATSP